MYLKSLTLKGFKSFADRTHMVFDPGLTVVVGPNGSGKSNVSDAILWVLGEQSAKMLRGQAMEDVVFSGSSARKPVSVAEVTLVLDNSDRTLPVDFSEVGITRRMYRSGESEYLINGAPARLMDIQDILHDSGLGKDTHSIISQGKLDSILASRPEERRSLIEEAAGISKHRRRKERSLKKLADMDKNLVRARDLAKEMNRQLRPLERQVDKARRFSELDSRLSELTCQLAVDDLRRLQEQWQKLDNQAKEASAAIELAQYRANEKTNQLEKLQSMLEQKGLFVGDLGEQRRRCSDILGRLESDMRLLEEKGRNMVDRLSETRLSLSQLERQRADVMRERAEIAGTLSDTQVAFDAAQASVDELGPAAEAAVAARREAGAAQAKVHDEVQDTQRNLDSAQLEQARLKDEISSAEVEDSMFASRLKQIDDSIETAEAALKSRQGRLEELVALASTAEADCASAKAAIEACEGEGRAAREAQSDAREALDSVRSELQSLKATLEALQALDVDLVSSDDTLEGKVLANKTLASLVEGRLADMVSAPEGLEDMVESLLGDALAAPIVAGTSEAQTLLEAALKEASATDSAGTMTVLLGDEAGEASVVADSAGEPLFGRLDVDESIAPLVVKLLGDVRIVKSAEEALKMHKKHPEYTYVSEDGLVASSDGRLRVGSNAGAAKGTLARHRKAQEMQKDLSVKEKALKSAEAAFEKAAQAVEANESALAECRYKAATAQGDLSRANAELESTKAEVARLESQLTSAYDERAGVEKQREAAAEAVSDAKPRLAELKERIAGLENKLSELKSQLDTLDAKRREASRSEEEASKKAADARLELATSRERIRHLKERSEDIEKRLASITERSEAAQESTHSLEVLRLRVDPLHERYKQIHEVVLEWAKRLHDRASIAEADSESLKKTISDARADANQATQELEQAKATENDIKVEKGRLEVRVEQAIQAITADGKHVLDEALQMPEPDDREAAEHEVANLRRQIEAIGPVNQVAMEEYNKLKERSDYIQEQLQDLESARAALTKITAAIDRKMRRAFLTTFEAVNNNFVEVFGMLFPGGRAYLEMTDPEHPAETGIEIVAQPRGKRITKMTLMSGGEKSLTALALLFAVYRTRTVPFYVFDEVEAALDDSNLDKLLDAIEQLKESTQLIVISHQRRTMEQADVLYGVSMQADGVSHVVSQRLDRATGKVVDA